MSEDDPLRTLYTVDQRGNRKWVYATIVDGLFRKRRRIVTGILFAFYLTMPWVKIRGEQGILLDFFSRKFVFFGSVFQATDTIYLFLVFAVLALLLFFLTAIYGRIWCGWACPETVFLEFLFRPIERWIEGDHLARRRLDQGPWTTEKIRKKLLKHSISAVSAWIIASTFLAYFVGREHLIQMMMAPPWENWPTFLVTLFLMGLMAFQFGWFREQFCTILCPYARFQSVLLDRHSLVIAYDQGRGEPRGKLKTPKPSDRGDCIDCAKCIRVCPTGIDIRNGLQLECINCTACIDACDSVMEKIRRPKGLIRYASEAELQGNPPHPLRPRVLIYAGILTLLISVLTVRLMNRDLTEVQFIRPPGETLFARIDQNWSANQFTLAILNKGSELETYEVVLSDPIQKDQVRLVIPIHPIPVPAGGQNKVPVFVQFKSSILSKGKGKVKVQVKNKSGFVSEKELSILGSEMK